MAISSSTFARAARDSSDLGAASYRASPIERPLAKHKPLLPEMSFKSVDAAIFWKKKKRNFALLPQKDRLLTSAVEELALLLLWSLEKIDMVVVFKKKKLTFPSFANFHDSEFSMNLK